MTALEQNKCSALLDDIEDLAKISLNHCIEKLSEEYKLNRNELIFRHNLNKNEVLSIGDRDIDILASQSAGIQSCLFNSKNIFTVNSNLCISNYKQLYEFILNGKF